MRIVQKYGGTSVGSTSRIENVANRVKAWHSQGHQIAVVVSAMSGETNRLLKLLSAISETPDPREQDMMLASGEQVSMALLAVALQKKGIQAQSFTGWQAGVITDNYHTKARISKVRTDNIKKCWREGKVAIVAGFQGIDKHGEITTLGRGGSDTSAVALATALKVDECQIYTDVDGVYSTDPRLVPNAKKIDHITFEEMLEMSSLGAKVLQIRSVELAYKQSVPLRVLSSLNDIDENYDFNNIGGTLIYPEQNNKRKKIMENVKISGVAFSKDEAQIKIKGVPDKPGIAFTILSAIAEANIEVDMIVQNTSDKNLTDFTFTVNRADYKKALEISKIKAKEIEAQSVVGNNKIVKVSLVGVGMRSHSGIASKMFQAFADAKINILIISTSEIKISVGLDEENLEGAVNILHHYFNLDK